MNGVVLVPEILERVNAEALLPKETDRRLQDLVVAWLLTCGGAETRKAYGADFREFGADRLGTNAPTQLGANAPTQLGSEGLESSQSGFPFVDLCE